MSYEGLSLSRNLARRENGKYYSEKQEKYEKTQKWKKIYSGNSKCFIFIFSRAEGWHKWIVGDKQERNYFFIKCQNWVYIVLGDEKLF